jgi:hypothetical protein
VIRRSGATLIEVLIAIFVSALGLLALLALFPLGALSMAHAIKDSKCAQASSNAAAIARFKNLKQDAALLPPTFASFLYGNDAYTNPSVFIPTTITLMPNLKTFNYYLTPGVGAPYDGPSYPVYIDALGVNLSGSSAPGYAGTTANNNPVPVNRQVVGSYPAPPALSPGFLRLGPSYANSTQQYIEWFTLLDDISYGSNGLPSGPLNPQNPTLTLIERTGKFSWAYLLRRANYAYSDGVDHTVVVYSDRSQATLGENSYYVDFVQYTVPGSIPPQPLAASAGGVPNNVVVIPLNQLQLTGQEKPRIRPGNWILDATVISNDPSRLPNSPQIWPDPHGFFYRVVNVSETNGQDAFGNPSQLLILELQTSIKGSSYINNPTIHYQGVLVVMDNVAEVFELGQL